MKKPLREKNNRPKAHDLIANRRAMLFAAEERVVVISPNGEKDVLWPGQPWIRFSILPRRLTLRLDAV